MRALIPQEPLPAMSQAQSAQVSVASPILAKSVTQRRLYLASDPEVIAGNGPTAVPSMPGPATAFVYAQLFAINVDVVALANHKARPSSVHVTHTHIRAANSSTLRPSIRDSAAIPLCARPSIQSGLSEAVGMAVRP
jgi:hypothetical protein